VSVQRGPQLALIPTVAPLAPLEDIVHKLGEQQAMSTSSQAAHSVQQVDIVWVQGGPQLALIPTVAPFAPLEDIVHKLGEQQAIPTPSQDAQSV
jgi:cyanophycinase-like exopeptidase